MELSDSDSEPNNDVLQLDLLQLRMALGKASQKDRTERPSAQSSEPGRAAENFAPQQVAQRDAMQLALDANRALQEQLEMVREQIAKFMQDNEKHTASITQLRVNPRQGECPERLGRSAIGPSRFWAQGNAVPEQNADAQALLPYYSYLPHRFEHPQLWSRKDCRELQAQVLLVVKDERTEALIEESWGDMAAMLKGTNEIIKGWGDDFWQERISPVNGRSGKVNRIHWHSHCSPSINDAEWAPEEESELLEIAQQYHHRNVSHAWSSHKASALLHSQRQGNYRIFDESYLAPILDSKSHHLGLQWEDVAEVLGTGRTAQACLLQVKRRDQLTQGKGAFTEEEQQRIREGVSLYGQNWTEIASHVGGGRDRQQVMHHYKNVMDVTRKGRWLPEEDRQLSQAVSIVGERKQNKWSSVAERVYGRSQTQCRERWCNVLDPTVKTGTPWTKNEVAILKELSCENQKPDGSIKWAAVASHLPGRTDSEVARQYWRLNG
ncbi:hypothetical protein ABBQ38_006965 [Trebouxia sp. C0009 RCD-2024]